MPADNILLGLSGGGFRATIFHLGVLRALRCYGLLGRVKAISSVSGGTITAAQVVRNWHEYANYEIDHFTTIESSIRDFVIRGIRERIMLRWPKGFVTRSNSTDLLVDEYRRLFADAKLSDLVPSVDAPRLFMMTTNLSRHSAYSYFSHDGYTLSDTRVPIVNTDLAVAVAASSAFPLMFPALVLDFAKEGATTAQAGASRDYLTDGGVFENLGLTVLRDYAKQNNMSIGHDTAIILSNAGRSIDWDLETNFSRTLFGNLNRALDVMQYWAEKRFLSALSSGEYQVSISDSAPRAQGAQSIPPEIVQKTAAYVRTDLDMFSSFEFRFLYDHGFTLASKLFEQQKNAWGLEDPVGRLRYQPWADDTLRQAQQRQTIDILRKPVRLVPRLRALRDVAVIPYFVAIVLLCVGAWYLLPIASNAFATITKWFDEQQFVTYPSQDIQFNKPLVGEKVTLKTSNLSREATAAIEAAQQRFILQYPGKIVAIVEQSAPFEHDYQSVHRWLRFQGEGQAGNVRPVYGTAFLVDTRDAHEGPRYREVRLAQSSPSNRNEIAGCIDISHPRIGEAIALVLLVTAIDEKDPISTLDVMRSTFTLGVSK
jgi:predicted acylesterase/phospholipase RssA